ncbi:MAG TPA: UDP-N-acetylmuramoyl-tripeptide--D-alanyl-D-alanine ligase [Bryobacteraceae bacterium]|nr:UDP-N-acetylmuramoyl-tripeptide--D-alanyl-D-alanine ligase [Bryobacteraceae bacterium]
MEFELTDVARALGLRVPGEARITGWSIDSRSVSPGDLFFALRGPNHDGNAYVEEVLRQGAVAAVANEQKAGPVLTVPDTLEALQSTAIWALQQWGGEVIGVTGSAGKTSTKDVIASMLAAGMPVGKTIGNLNNHMGVPLSILRLPGDARVAVLEMGMNHAGEIRALCAIAKPRIGVVTNVGHAHMEAFDSIEGVAAAKRELIESLPPDGVAVLNADDPLVSKFRAAHSGCTLTFGINSPADMRADHVQLTDQGVSFQVDGVRFESALVGRHSVSNILAGLAVASLYGIRPQQLMEVVRDLAAPAMRGQRLVHNGVVILNDCYNSNPDAARVMIDVLRETPAKRRIAVLGEMLELGRWSESLHRDVGSYVAKSGIDVLVGIRGEACHLVDAARQSGLAVDAAFFFPDSEAAGEHLRKIARPGDVILLKGSRGTHVEHALERFLARPN